MFIHDVTCQEGESGNAGAAVAAAYLTCCYSWQHIKHSESHLALAVIPLVSIDGKCSISGMTDAAAAAHVVLHGSPQTGHRPKAHIK